MSKTFVIIGITIAVFLIITCADGRTKCGPTTDTSQLPKCPTSDNTNCLREPKYTDECFTNNDCLPGNYCCRGPCGNNECSRKGLLVVFR